MRIIKKMVSIILILALTMFLVPGCSSTKDNNQREEGAVNGKTTTNMEKFISIGTTSTGGSWHPLGVALAQVWTENIEGTSFSAAVTDGGNENLERLKMNDMQIAFCAMATCYESLTNTGQYEDKPDSYKDFKVIANVYPSFFQFPVLKKSGIKSIHDIIGKRINLGPAGSGSRSMNLAILDSIGISLDSFHHEAINHSNAVDLVIDEKLDGYMLVANAGQPHQMKSMSSGKVVMIGFSDEDAEKIIEKCPYFYRLTMPAGIYPNQDYEVPGIATGTFLICRDDVSEELVYQVTKTMWEELDTLIEINALFKEFNINEATNIGGFDLHPGAERYYKEKGLL